MSTPEFFVETDGKQDRFLQWCVTHTKVKRNNNCNHITSGWF